MSYLLVALIAFGFVVKLTGTKNPHGAVLLALIWPVLIPTGIYFLVKKFVFKRHGPSQNPIVWELECLGILAVTALGLVIWRFPQLLHG